MIETKKCVIQINKCMKRFLFIVAIIYFITYFFALFFLFFNSYLTEIYEHCSITQDAHIIQVSNSLKCGSLLVKTQRNIVRDKEENRSKENKSVFLRAKRNYIFLNEK